jgi:hypothetical protein
MAIASRRLLPWSRTPMRLRRASADAPRKAMDFAIILSFCAIG